MTMETVCLFHNYGYCKYRETCRNIHYKETCEVKSCETPGCAKRHPKNCRYFNIYNRCKFGTFCSFAHVTSEVSNNYEDEETKAKIANLDSRVKTLEEEIKLVNADMKTLEEKNDYIEREVHTTFENMKVICEIMVKKATDAVVEMIFEQQNTIENNQKEGFDNLSSQLTELIAKYQPSTSNPCQPPQPSSEVQASPQPLHQVRFPCDKCGKSFGSGRALANHERKDHVPSQNTR